MEPDPNTSRGNRETLLTLALTALCAGGILFFLILISGGFFVFVVAVVFAIALIGLLHYALWGHSLSQEVAGERAEEEAQARWEETNEDVRFWERPRRF